MKKVQSSNIFIYAELIFLILLGISKILRLDYLTILFLILILIFPFLLKKKSHIIYLFILLPFFNILNLEFGSTSLFYLCIVLYFLRIFLNNDFKIEKKKVLIFVLLFIIRLTCGDLELVIKWILSFGLLLILYDEDDINNNWDSIIKYMSLSHIIASVIGFIMLENGMSIYINGIVYSSLYGRSIRFAGLIGDPVFYSQFTSLLIACLFTLCFNKKHKYVYYILIIILFAFSTLTYAKTGLIIDFLLLIMYLFLLIKRNSKSRKTFFKNVVILVICVITLILSVHYIKNNSNDALISNYFIRFSAEDLMTGRGEVSRHYIDKLISSWRTPFIAMKQSTYYEFYVTSKGQMVNRAHNIYIETVCAYGLLASICMFAWLVKVIFITVFKEKKVINLFPIIVLILSGITLHGHFEWIYYYMLLIAICFLQKLHFEEE